MREPNQISGYMRAYYERSMESENDAKGGRTQPWTDGMSNPEHRYYDLRREPKHIRESLEDFVVLGDSPAVERFYELLEWLNGPNGSFETNDCGCNPIKPSTGDEPLGVRPRKLSFHGRLMLFWRQLEANADDARVGGLIGHLLTSFNKPKQLPEAVCIGLWRMPTIFLEASPPCEGWSICLSWWVWGDSEAEVMETFGEMLTEVEKALSEAK